MDTCIPWIAAPAVFALGWYLLGYAEARAAGFVSLLAGTALLALPVFSTTTLPSSPALAALALVLGLYLATEGAVAVWNLGARTVGFLAGFAAVALAVLGTLLALDGFTSDPTNVPSATIGLAALLFVPPAAIRFAYDALHHLAARRLAGWAFVVSAWVGWALPGATLAIHHTLT